jgi:ATP-binding cassette subfamily B protein
MGFLAAGLAGEAYDRTYSDGQLIWRIARYFRPHARTVVFVALMVLLSAAVTTIAPFVIARGIDALSGQRDLQILLGLAGLVTVLGGLSWMFNYVRQRYSTEAVGDVVLTLREDAFQAVMRRDRAFFDQFASGRIISRVTSDTQDFATVVTLTIELLSQLGMLLVVSGVMLAVNWQLGLVVIATGPVVIGVALGFRWLARRVMRQSQRAQAEVNAIVQETISGIAVAKNFRREAALFNDFQSINRLAYDIQIQRVAVFGSIFPLLNTISGLATAAVIYVGGLLVINSTVSLGDWYLFVQTLLIFFFPITSLASFWSQFQQGLAASERVFSLIDADVQVRQRSEQPVGRLAGQITFEDVWFSYDADQTMDGGRWTVDDGLPVEDERRTIKDEDSGLVARAPTMPVGLAPAAEQSPNSTVDSSMVHRPSSSWVLHGFSLAIPAGQTLAVVGHTGAGKSSLVKLLLRFYEFQGGRLFLDGRDIRDLSLPEYRRQIGYVPQQPFLFSGSVADNIRYGRPEASDDEVLAAARQLADGSWLDDLPSGLATDVGERGARLSLGQRQLVALARVLLQNPAILLLDEATASIDPFTEAQVQAALAITLQGRTSIVIAHRLSTVRAADRIIVLRTGQIIESGRHEELLEQGGHYAELYATYFRHQALDYRPWDDLSDQMTG